jgi:hypothetical protein
MNALPTAAQPSTSIEWGSVADWISGVGTAGALVLAFIIILRDRLKDDRRLADAFITWMTFAMTRAVKGKADWTVTIRGYNAGSTPVVGTMIWNLSEAPNIYRQTMKIQKGDMSISPGETVVSEIGLDHDPRGNRFLIRFVDSSGRIWLRDIDTGKYLSKRQEKRLQKAEVKWLEDLVAAAGK